MIGCSGFPVPPTRYFKDFAFVEVQETYASMPGASTVKRWRREAPAGFEFGVLAPREIGQEAFRRGKIVDAALDSLTEIVTLLAARIAVFTCPPELEDSRANRAAIKEFLGEVKKRFERIVLEVPPTWESTAAVDLALAAKVIPAVDPLSFGLAEAKVAYYRLPGPAGHKSRYEDPAMERLAELALGARHDEAFYVFTNVDMAQDARRLKRAIGSRG